ncbi:MULTISPECIES: glycosyltransferase [Streptomyces]|uniref:Glycosyl transferase family 2 n=1 Tax=Streptomyces virginiae TaxID=1961 RepID=A0A0L8MTZ0_STRVG|nr:MULTISPECIES: glycosyltransferase [Streptomyces]ARE75095.1 glycosyl transferase family 2 [Streptomyces sp. Sge12]KOG53853.1 glycosyl transferase family 2 [Streptomyces virginiae]KOU25288.1 glycosyl transferase family 2 [Streptomyces sp. WM6368]
MSRFEILLPYYGDVTLMQDAVRSVLAQDGDDWRLTVVDDGREPGVPEWFEQLADPRVRYLRNERNLGVTGNFNRCVELAEYEYLVLMGCDDLMHPNYLQVVRATADREPTAAMIQPGVQVIGTDGLPFDTLGDRTKRKIYAPKGPGRALLGGEELATSLLRGNWLYFPSICWRTEAVKRFGFRTDLGVIQDLALVVDLLVAGETLATTPEVCFSYRRHAESESSAKAYTGHRFEEAKRFFVETADRLDRHGWPRAAKVSRLHLSSRLHALTLLPGAARKAGRPGVSAMLRHATR